MFKLVFKNLSVLMNWLTPNQLSKSQAVEDMSRLYLTEDDIKQQSGEDHLESVESLEILFLEFQEISNLESCQQLKYDASIARQPMILHS